MLQVKNLVKTYPTFALKDVSFELPKGYIMGFVGRNGAGKTTTLKSLLNIVRPDSGEVRIFGKDIAENELELKQKISFTLGAFDFYACKTCKKIERVYRNFYADFDGDEYRRLMAQFEIHENKRVKELSAGMKVKFALALALAHKAELFIFDEPTSGLDPVARDELLDIFRSIVEDGEKSILFSTHITSDLDKCADYVVMIRDGAIVLSATKDDAIDAHRILKGKKEQLTPELQSRVIAYKTNAYGFSALIRSDRLTDADGALMTEVPNLEDLLVYYNKEEIAR